MYHSHVVRSAGLATLLWCGQRFSVLADKDGTFSVYLGGRVSPCAALWDLQPFPLQPQPCSCLSTAPGCSAHCSGFRAGRNPHTFRFTHCHQREARAS